MTADGRGNYIGADDALDIDDPYDGGDALNDDDEYCAWCQRGGEMQSFEGRPFCGEDCANAWWYEWGHDDD